MTQRLPHNHNSLLWQKGFPTITIYFCDTKASPQSQFPYVTRTLPFSQFHSLTKRLPHHHNSLLWQGLSHHHNSLLWQGLSHNHNSLLWQKDFPIITNAYSNKRLSNLWTHHFPIRQVGCPCVWLCLIMAISRHNCAKLLEIVIHLEMTLATCLSHHNTCRLPSGLNQMDGNCTNLYQSLREDDTLIVKQRSVSVVVERLLVYLQGEAIWFLGATDVGY